MEEASRGVVNLICFFILGIFAATSGLTTDAVDIFNVKSGTWTTAVLSVARTYLAATSLPNDGLAIFAGGFSAFCISLFLSRNWAKGYCFFGCIHVKFRR